MRHAMRVVAIGLGGLALAVALSIGAFALAGRSVQSPAVGIQIAPPSVKHDRHETATSPPNTPSPGPDDHGGASPSEHSGEGSPPTGDDHGGGGHGSDD